MTKQLPIENELYVKLEAKAEEKGMTLDEYVVELIDNMIGREEFERVSIVVPKSLLRLMKDQHFFGTTKEAFFIKCIERGVGCELSNLPVKENHELERKYKANIDWARIWLRINS